MASPHKYASAQAHKRTHINKRKVGADQAQHSKGGLRNAYCSVFAGVRSSSVLRSNAHYRGSARRYKRNGKCSMVKYPLHTQTRQLLPPQYVQANCLHNCPYATATCAISTAHCRAASSIHWAYTHNGLYHQCNGMYGYHCNQWGQGQ